MVVFMHWLRKNSIKVKFYLPMDKAKLSSTQMKLTDS